MYSLVGFQFVELLITAFHDFYGQYYAYPTVNNSDSDEQSSEKDE